MMKSQIDTAIEAHEHLYFCNDFKTKIIKWLYADTWKIEPDNMQKEW